MITLKTYAKINLGLRIIGKREDGFHDIETIFHRIDLYDEIIVENSSELIFESNEKKLVNDESNLCTKAASLLKEYATIDKCAKISLIKNIPIGAGLGGGSSDAAATLIALTKLWKLNISKKELYKIAIQLGSDVPYFLENGTAHAFGRGEILTYFDLSIPCWIVTVYPNIHISTEWAYHEYDNLKNSKHTQDLNTSLKQIVLENINEPKKLNFILHNDFEPIVLHKYQQLGHLKLLLYSEGASFAQLTGSGSSIYGFFINEDDAFNIVNKLSKKYKVFVTPPNFKSSTYFS